VWISTALFEYPLKTNAYKFDICGKLGHMRPAVSYISMEARVFDSATIIAAIAALIKAIADFLEALRKWRR
jgi:hypothetical protein